MNAVPWTLVLPLQLLQTGLYLAATEEAVPLLGRLADVETWTGPALTYSWAGLLLSLASAVLVGALAEAIRAYRWQQALEARGEALDEQRRLLVTAIIDLLASPSLRDWPDATWRQLARIHGELTGFAPLAGVPRPPDDSLPWEEA
ncbi:hypothetical protein L6R53_14060 [Myxococcota bacterium]|nr:hypothetical protein [Myxococcota bacterium]